MPHNRKNKSNHKNTNKCQKLTSCNSKILFKKGNNNFYNAGNSQNNGNNMQHNLSGGGVRKNNNLNKGGRKMYINRK